MKLLIFKGIAENREMRSEFKDEILYMGEHLVEPKMDGDYLRKYLTDDADTVTFILVNDKKTKKLPHIGALLGIAICEKWINKKGYENQFYLAALMTYPQRQGFGTYMLKEIENYAKNKTAAEFVSIRATTSSEHFYREHGYIYGYAGAICERKNAGKREIDPNREVPMSKCIRQKKSKKKSNKQSPPKEPSKVRYSKARMMSFKGYY